MVKVHGVVEPDVIYSLIASGEVYMNLSKVVLAEPAHVRLFANARVAAEYREISRELEEGGSISRRALSERGGPCRQSSCRSYTSTGCDHHADSQGSQSGRAWI